MLGRGIGAANAAAGRSERGSKDRGRRRTCQDRGLTQLAIAPCEIAEGLPQTESRFPAGSAFAERNSSKIAIRLPDLMSRRHPLRRPDPALNPLTRTQPMDPVTLPIVSRLFSSARPYFFFDFFFFAAFFAVFFAFFAFFAMLPSSE